MGILDSVKIRERYTKDKKFRRIRGRAVFEAEHVMDAEIWKNLSPVEKVETRKKLYDDIKSQIYSLFIDLAVEDLEHEVQGGVALSRRAKRIFLVAPTRQSVEAYDIVTKYLLDIKDRNAGDFRFGENIGRFKPRR